MYETDTFRGAYLEELATLTACANRECGALLDIDREGCAVEYRDLVPGPDGYEPATVTDAWCQQCHDTHRCDNEECS